MDDYLVTILSGKSAKADDKFKKVSAFFVTFEVTDSTEDGRQLGQHWLDPVAVVDVVQLGVQGLEDVPHSGLDLVHWRVDKMLENGQRGKADGVVYAVQPQQQTVCKSLGMENIVSTHLRAHENKRKRSREWPI